MMKATNVAGNGSGSTMPFSTMTVKEAEACQVRIEERLEEAQAGIENAETSIKQARAEMTELHRRQGWRALGYRSWDECVQKIFHKSKRHANRLIQSLETEIAIRGEDGMAGGTLGPNSHISERSMRPLYGKTPEVAKKVYQAAAERSGGKTPSGKHVQEAMLAEVEAAINERQELRDRVQQEQDELIAKQKQRERKGQQEQVDRSEKEMRGAISCVVRAQEHAVKAGRRLTAFNVLAKRAIRRGQQFLAELDAVRDKLIVME